MMIYYAVLVLIVALIGAVFVAVGAFGPLTLIAQVLFYVLLAVLMFAVLRSALRSRS